MDEEKLEKVDLDETGKPVVVDARITCLRCKVKQEPNKFYRSNGSNTGYQAYCKVCMDERKRMVRRGEIPSKALRAGKIGTELVNLRMKKVAHALIDNPKAELKVLAEAAGVSVNTVSVYLAKGQVLRALRALGGKEVTRMIPMALKGYRDILEQRDNLSELNKVSTKVLENEKVIGPHRVDVGVLEMKEHTTEELMQIVKEANGFPDQVIMEAEVVE